MNRKFAYIKRHIYNQVNIGDIVELEPRDDRFPHGVNAIHAATDSCYFYRWEWLDVIKSPTKLERALYNIMD